MKLLTVLCFAVVLVGSSVLAYCAINSVLRQHSKGSAGRLGNAASSTQPQSISSKKVNGRQVKPVAEMARSSHEPDDWFPFSRTDVLLIQWISGAAFLDTCVLLFLLVQLFRDLRLSAMRMKELTHSETVARNEAALKAAQLSDAQHQIMIQKSERIKWKSDLDTWKTEASKWKQAAYQQYERAEALEQKSQMNAKALREVFRETGSPSPAILAARSLQMARVKQ